MVETFSTGLSSDILILLGNGDGTLQTPTEGAGFNGSPNFGLGQLAAADFDGDGSLDVAVPSTPLTVLYGQPANASVVLAPGALGFGNQGLGGTSAVQSVTLTNLGRSALTITSVTITGAQSGGYLQSNTCGNSVAANGNCQIKLTFTPSASGVRNATVIITDNATNSPQTVGLSGAGIGLGLGMASGSSASATVSAG
jgi:hypothetical protein